MKQSFVPRAEECKDGLLSKYLDLVGVLKSLVESMAKRPAGSGGGGNKVFDVVRAGQAVGWRWWNAGRHWRCLKVGCVVSVGPRFGWSAPWKDKTVHINEAVPLRVIDEESSVFFRGQAV